MLDIGRLVSGPSGYTSTHYPEHPKSDRKGYVHLHRLVAENSIGRLHGLQRGRKTCLVECPQCGLEFYKFKSQTHLDKNTATTSCSISCSVRLSHRIRSLTHAELSDIKSKNIVLEFILYPLSSDLDRNIILGLYPNLGVENFNYLKSIQDMS